MKFLIALVVLCCIQAIRSESCNPNNGNKDCQNTQCSTGHALECEHHQCTCVDHQSKCGSAAECQSDQGRCRIFGRPGTWHCIDAKCRCFFVR